MAQALDSLQDVDWQTEAVALELLSLSFRYPDDVLCEAVLSGEWLGAALDVARVLELDLPEGFEDARLAVGADGSAIESVEGMKHALRAEATHLFVGAPNAAVSPYEGIWRAGDDGVQGLLFVNPHSMAVERFMGACGLGKPEGTNEPLDHVSTELEVLQYLAMLEAGMTQPLEGAVPADALPGGSPAAAYAQFVSEHAATWLPRFARAVQEQARLPFYRAAAQLLGALPL